MAARKDDRIYSNRSSTDEPGLFSRLLHRSRSKKEKNKPIPEKTSDPGPQWPAPELRTNERNRASTTEALTLTPAAVPEPASPRVTSTTATMGAPTAHYQQQHQQQQPSLKKRASIRDRFRALARDTPSSTVELEKQQKRVVYVPTHAAADFQRVSLSPRPSSRQQLRYSYDEPRTILQTTRDSLDTMAAGPPEDESQCLVTSRLYPPRPLQTLDENEPVQVVSVQRQTSHREEEGDRQPLLTASANTSRQHSRGHVAAVDPSPNHAVRLSAPVSHASANSDGHGFPDLARPEQSAEARLENATAQPSDYELFLARAEERERAHRDQLIRSLSQRQYTPRPEPEAAVTAPLHYRNSATYTADSAVVAEPSVPPLRKGWDGRLSGGLDSGIGSKSGSKSSSNQGDRLARQSDDHAAARVSSTWERGHRKHSSWAPSFVPGGNDGERKLERGPSAVPEGGEVDNGAYTTSRNHNMASFVERSQAAQQPRTLRKQTSIKKKLSEYIKPAKPPSRYEEPKYLPEKPAFDLRRSKSEQIGGT